MKRGRDEDGGQDQLQETPSKQHKQDIGQSPGTATGADLSISAEHGKTEAVNPSTASLENNSSMDASAKPAVIEQGLSGSDALGGGEQTVEPENGDGTVAEKQQGASSDDDEWGEDNYQPQRQTAGVRRGAECPYLDTISRQNLDFDFEKCCSVSLSPINVYACLVCGKYFQGRGPKTHAYTHSLEMDHHMYMKLDDGKVYCLPEGYEVVDRSLDIIRFVLNPTFTPAEVQKIDKSVTWSRALDGNEYMPGLLGLNNMKHNDYVNVLLQILMRVQPIRDFFLDANNYKSIGGELVKSLGELVRRMWNPRNFKGQVSPHEFMQTVMRVSQKRFSIDQQGEPVEFWSWLLNSLHLELTGGKRKKSSVVSRCFQGELEVTTEAGSGKGAAASLVGEDLVQRVPFLMLGLDLPPAPLYKDKNKEDIIPQIPIFELLRKFDGERTQADIKLGRRKYTITKLPPFLVLHVKRFINNRYFTEKNPTIVNFPVKNLELRTCIPIPKDAKGEPQISKYDLIANVVHDGRPDTGTYRVHMHRKVEDQWYEVENLRVVDILPQVVVLSETYLQVYEQQSLSSR